MMKAQTRPRGRPRKSERETTLIWWFFNCSWWFMDAYQQGLTGKAAEWAVKRQKSHRRVGQQAMISIEAVLNTN